MPSVGCQPIRALVGNRLIDTQCWEANQRACTICGRKKGCWSQNPSWAVWCLCNWIFFWFYVLHGNECLTYLVHMIFDLIKSHAFWWLYRMHKAQTASYEVISLFVVRGALSQFNSLKIRQSTSFMLFRNIVRRILKLQICESSSGQDQSPGYEPHILD